jgi:hypothetical protein
MWNWSWMRRITTGSRTENEKRKIIFQIHEGSIQQQDQRPEPPGAGLVVFAWSIRVFIVLYGCDCAHARLFFRAPLFNLTGRIHYGFDFACDKDTVHRCGNRKVTGIEKDIENHLKIRKDTKALLMLPFFVAICASMFVTYVFK